MQNTGRKTLEDIMALGINRVLGLERLPGLRQNSNLYEYSTLVRVNGPQLAMAPATRHFFVIVKSFPFLELST